LSFQDQKFNKKYPKFIKYLKFYLCGLWSEKYMKKAPIAIVAVIVVFAFIGGYFTGIMNSAGNFTLNITNKSDDNGSNYDTTPTTNYKTNTMKTTVKNTTDTTTTDTPSTDPKPKPTPGPVENTTK
jgi:hypothetical protein